jgi:hypothetical protein
MTLVELAAVAAAVLMAAVIAFQVALTAGLPLGEATMGGRAPTVDGVLEPRYRAIAAGSAVILALAAWIVLGRAGMVTVFLDGQALAWAAWIVAGFMAPRHQSVRATPARAMGWPRLRSWRPARGIRASAAPA